jgi:hypothetical protein
MMGLERCEQKRTRTSRSKDRSRQSSKGSEVWRPEILNGDESAEAEEVDRLLLSSLKLWEVERDLIEERMAAKKSARTGSMRRPNIAA